MYVTECIFVHFCSLFLKAEAIRDADAGSSSAISPWTPIIRSSRRTNAK